MIRVGYGQQVKAHHGEACEHIADKGVDLEGFLEVTHSDRVDGKPRLSDI
jgi:hypothetical protein